MEFLQHIEQLGFCQWVRESDSLFAYSGILLLHTVGMGFVVGINACIDLRILGFAPGIRLSGMEKFFPILWIGFWINAITGTILLLVEITSKLANPDFYVKMACIALALIALRMTKVNVFRDPTIDKTPPSGKAKMWALMSLVSWTGAIIAGRLLAYVGSGNIIK